MPPSSRTSRARVLDAALAVFASHGTEGSSVQDVANRAGMSKQAVLHHFRSKDELRDGVYQLLAERFRTQLPLVAADLVSRSHDRYRAIIEVALERFDESPEAARFLTYELLERPAAVLKWIRTEAAPWLGLIGGVVQQSEVRQPGFDAEAHVAVLGALMLMQSALVPRADRRWRARMRKATLRAMVVASHLAPDQKS